ncbi:hypothetical protein H0H81_004731 [Sphagnurus paluster]|uniref:Uncharacterized protein n=1 Tax=Sphagnurus paluster TaxID=117069 RepID=A0A9P7GWT7_9AGAR|nr:hypothetical protein H0H81_004731 [Sphagnurus paluster]
MSPSAIFSEAKPSQSSCGCKPENWKMKSDIPSSSTPSKDFENSILDAAVVKTIEAKLDEINPELRELSLKIHGKPELGWEETYAHEEMTDFMEKYGFTVSRRYAGMNTAWRAEFVSGTGGRVLGINSEMDALPGIGHACGHNLIGICGIGIAVAVQAAMIQHKVSGKIVLLGTPAEENGGGKIKLIENGDFKEMDVCVMAHPSSGEVASVSDGAMNALQSMVIKFGGHGAHSAAAPWQGKNALDAAVLAYNSVSMLRQQIKPECRIHGIMKGENWTANTIPDNAELLYIVRATSKPDLEDLSRRVEACFHAAAAATGCNMKITLNPQYLDVVQNSALAKDFADNCVARYGMTSNHIGTSASTDFVSIFTQIFFEVIANPSSQGNVSYAVPALHPLYGIPTVPNGGNHTPLFTAAAATQVAHDITMKVTKGLSLTSYRVLTDEDFLAEVKSAYKVQMKAQGENGGYAKVALVDDIILLLLTLSHHTPEAFILLNMVLFFTSNVVEPSAIIYMGRDKVENEELIKYAWPQDVWFHVDKLSSAHVYLRMPDSMAWDTIPEALLADCGQLVKANSIEGNKKDNLTIIYTPADNLKKTGDMAVGQVSFHSDKRALHIAKRENVIVNRLNKTKMEKVVDHEQERVDRAKAESAVRRAAAAEKKKADLELARQREAEKAARSYDSLFSVEEEEGIPRKTGRELEEDFM